MKIKQLKLKRSLALLLSLFLLPGLCACAGAGDSAATPAPVESDEPAPTPAQSDLMAGLAGYYLAVEIDGGESDSSPEDLRTLAEFGMYLTLTLTEDGTGEMDMFGNVFSLTWDSEGIDFGDGDAGLLAFEDGILRITNPDGDGIILLEKVDALPESSYGAGGEEPNIEETVLLNEMDVKITATGIDYEGWAGPELMLTVENKAEETLIFAGEDVYVNGCKIVNGFYTELAPGETADEPMTLYTEEMTTYGIDTIAEIAMVIRVSDTDWDTYCETGLITLRTDVSETYAFTFDPGGEVLYDEGGFRVINMGRADEDTYWGPAALLYFENNTDRPVTFRTRDESVNGSAVTDIVLSTTLFPGMRAVEALTLGKDELKELGVDEIETLALRFLVFDAQTGGEILTTDAIKITF